MAAGGVHRPVAPRRLRGLTSSSWGQVSRETVLCHVGSGQTLGCLCQPQTASRQALGALAAPCICYED